MELLQAGAASPSLHISTELHSFPRALQTVPHHKPLLANSTAGKCTRKTTLLHSGFKESQGYAGFLCIKANRRFLAYLGQLTTAFKLSSHLILQTSCKQSIKKGSAEESRTQAFQTSNLNPKGRNKTEIKGEHRDHLNMVCCFAHWFFFCSVPQTRARRRWKMLHEELSREAICGTRHHISSISQSQQ